MTCEDVSIKNIDFLDIVKKDDEGDGYNDSEISFLKKECPICLELIETDDYAILTRCCHKFHEKCIKDWFLTSKSYKCPECNIINRYRIINKIYIPPSKIGPYNTHVEQNILLNKNITRTPIETHPPDVSKRTCRCIIC